MATKKKAVKKAAVKKAVVKRPSRGMGPLVELFGHVTLVESYSVPGFLGCHALVSLRDSPGVIIAVLTTEIRHQSQFTAALETGNLIAFRGHQYMSPPTPIGGTWAVEVYDTNGVILYNFA